MLVVISHAFLNNKWLKKIFNLSFPSLTIGYTCIIFEMYAILKDFDKPMCMGVFFVHTQRQLFRKPQGGVACR